MLDRQEKTGIEESATATATMAHRDENESRIEESRGGNDRGARWRSKSWTAAFLLIVAAGIFFRFYKIDQKEYWCDEAYTSLMISGHVRTEFYRDACTGKPIAARVLQTEYQMPHGPIFSATRDAIAMGGHHPPLYFLLTRIWAERFGCGVIQMRILPALFSVLALPAVYWLCLELFESVAVARIAVALNAVSPYLVVHAQNAREYSLWLALIALCSAAFLRAVKLQRRKDWIVYAILSAVSFYTYSFSVFVSFSHCLWLFWKERLRPTALIVSQLQAILLTVVLCLPWLSLIVTRHTQVIDDMAWVEEKTPLLKLAGHWRDILAWSFAHVPDPRLQTDLSYGILALTAVSAFLLIRKAQSQQWIFVACLTACSIVPLLIPDLVFGGFRTVILRYMMPAVLGLFLTVSFAIAQAMTAQAHSMRIAGRVTLAGLIALGVASCFFNWQNPRPLQFTVGQDLFEMARVINASPKPLMVCNAESQAGQILAAVRLLRGDVPVLLIKGPRPGPLPAGYREVYAFDPDTQKPMVLGLDDQFDRSAATPFFGTLSKRGD